MDDIVVIDNVVEQVLQDSLEKALLGHSVPWHFVPDITHNDRSSVLMITRRMGFSYILYNKESSRPASPRLRFLAPICFEAVRRVGLTLAEITQCRAFLQLPDNMPPEASRVNNPHVDSPMPHTVVLYYPHDAQGDTVIYEQTLDDVPYIPKDQKKPVAWTEKQRVPPKKGRAVVFNGNRYHSSSNPFAGPRCVLNFNFTNPEQQQHWQQTKATRINPVANR